VIIKADTGAVMEIRQLRAFVAIAESGTFTAGALRVHVTQAAISMQIRQLETEIGAKVFVRAPRHVILTEAGATSSANTTPRSMRLRSLRAPSAGDCELVVRRRWS
jgi:DNA-binding transcriptional LysR family regulator